MNENPARPQYRDLSLAALLLGAVIIGLSPIFVRVSELGPVTTAFWRVALALLPLLALRWTGISPANGEVDRPTSLRDIAALALPGLMLAGDLLAWHLAIHLTSIANATLLANMAPVFVVLAGWLLYRTAVSSRFLAGLAVSVAGVVILQGGSLSGGDSHIGGDALALLGGMFYAGYILGLSRLRRRYSTITIMLWSSASAALFILPAALLTEQSFWPMTLFAWTIVLCLGWLIHVAGQGMITFALALLPAAFSSLTLLIQPVIAAAVAWILLNEPLGLLQALGGVIVLAGIVVARRG